MAPPLIISLFAHAITLAESILVLAPYLRKPRYLLELVDPHVKVDMSGA
jgi:hypothetical protein